MKLIRLAILDIISFAKEKTMVFVLLVVGITLSCFCAIYYYSYQKTIESNWSIGADYFIEFNEPLGSKAADDIIQVLEGIENSPYIPYGLKLLDQNSYESMDYMSTKSSRTMPAEYIKDPDYKYTLPRGIVGINDYSFPDDSQIINGRNLTEEDKLINGALGDPKCKPGDILTFYGYDFEIVGNLNYNYALTFPLYVMIPARQYLDLNLPCKYIIVNFQRIPPQKLIEAISQAARRIDPDVKLFEPEDLPKSVTKSFTDEIFKVFIIVSLSITYIFALFRYWIQDSFKKYAIFTITGASIWLIQLIVIISAIFLVIGPYIISVGLFNMIDALIGLPDITYFPHFKEHILIAIIISIIAIIVTLPTLWTLRKSSLHNLVQ